jgi:transposase
MPDFAELHRQRQLNRHLTQQLLWEEYRQANPDGYRYSRFCELYQRWRRKQEFPVCASLKMPVSKPYQICR